MERIETASPLVGAPALHGRSASVGTFRDISTGPSGLPLLGSHVHETAVAPDGALYVAGEFRVAGSSIWRIARRVGTTWQGLGNGLSGGAVNALAVAPDGMLYAGGAFDYHDFWTPTNRFSRWDGSAWHNVGDGPGGVTQDIALGLDGSVYAAGYFNVNGSSEPSPVARWDGSAWHPVGIGATGEVTSIQIAPDGSVVVAGSFSMVGGIPALNVARWDGSVWSAMGDGVPAQRMSSLEISADGSVLVGTDDGESGGRVMRWTGTAWEQVGASFDGGVDALSTPIDGSIVAGGSFTAVGPEVARYLARWNGSSWATLDENSVNGSVLALTAVAGSGLVVGGEFRAVGSQASFLVARVDESGWEALGSSADYTLAQGRVAAGNDGSVYALSEPNSTIGGIVSTGVSRWDGTEWTALPALEDGVALKTTFYASLVVSDQGEVYVEAVDDAGVDYVYRWDGATWERLSNEGSLRVLALQIAADGTLYGLRSTTNKSGANVVRRAGSGWEVLGTRSFPWINSYAIGTNGVVYVSSQTYSPEDQYQARIYSWDGIDWLERGVVRGFVDAMTVTNEGHLVVVGKIESVDGIIVPNAALWDGSAWSPMGSSGLYNAFRVSTLVVAPNAAVYAIGTLQPAAGKPWPMVARWYGEEWEIFSFKSSFISGFESASMFDDGSFVMSGNFEFVNDVVSPYVVLYRPPGLVAIQQSPTQQAISLTISPNPSSSAATAILTVEQPTEVLARVYDALGRVVETVLAGSVPAGQTRVALPDGLAPGVYVLRVRSGAAVQTARFVVAR